MAQQNTQYTPMARTPVRPSTGWTLKHGISGGIIAGLVFAAFAMIMSAFLAGNAFTPLRMIGAIILGQQALDPSYPLTTAAATGVVLHLVLSVVYGVIFAGLIRLFPPLSSSTPALVFNVAAFGFLLWLINFWVIAPIFFFWFTMTNPAVQFLAHVFFFGAVLGFYFSRVHPSPMAHKTL